MRILQTLLFLSLINLYHTSFADQVGLERYSDSKRVFWTELYDRPAKSLYCNQDFDQRYGLNIEHVFAASWMKNQGGCAKMNRKECRRFSPRFNHMEADLHNLYPTRTKVNSNRSNFPFTIIEGKSRGNCDFEVSGNEFEPAPHARGKVARAVLYMEHEYGSNIDKDTNSPGQKDLLVSWHCNFPVEEDDVIRNAKIVEMQGTSNPYIDGSIEIDCSKVFDYPED